MKRIAAALALLCATTSLAAHCEPAIAPVLPQLQNSRVEIAYVPPANSYLRPTYERLKKRQVLEELRQFLAPLRLPRRLLVKTMQCNQTNAFYSPSEVSVQLCYEFIDWVERLAPRETTPEGVTRDNVILGGFIEVLMHELGHAVVDLLQVPVFGREEDAADQLAGFIMLQFGKQVARRTITGTVQLYLEQSQVIPRTDFSDTHSTDLQRFYNYLCIAYGGDAETFKDFVERKLLPQSRAGNCAREYQQVRWAFLRLINPFIDQDLLKIVQSRDWLRPDDGKLQ